MAALQLKIDSKEYATRRTDIVNSIVFKRLVDKHFQLLLLLFCQLDISPGKPASFLLFYLYLSDDLCFLFYRTQRPNFQLIFLNLIKDLLQLCLINADFVGELTVFLIIAQKRTDDIFILLSQPTFFLLRKLYLTLFAHGFDDILVLDDVFLCKTHHLVHLKPFQLEFYGFKGDIQWI